MSFDAAVAAMRPSVYEIKRRIAALPQPASAMKS